MKFIIIFEDNPDLGTDVRAKFMRKHLAFLERNASTVLAAGPLKTTDGRAAGGLWLIDAADPSGIDALVREDPFWSAGLRKSVQVFCWNQVFADGRSLIAGR